MDIGARSENTQPGQVDTIIKVLRILVVMLISCVKVARVHCNNDDSRLNIPLIIQYENHNISKADVLLFLCDPLPRLEAFKCLNWSHCTGWRDLNI